MTISSELEKIAVLRDRGDLSDAEFEKAKALLLSGDTATPGATPPPLKNALADKKKNRKTQLTIAIAASVAAVLSGGSAIINPSPLHLVIVVIWVIAATLGWISYAKLATEINRHGASE